jgi:ABC-type glycerol-3-phosphate transport system substrate-binding protein
MPTKRFYLFLLSILLLMSCFSKENGELMLSGEAGPLILAVPEGTTTTFRVLVEAYEEANPGVTVHVESMNRLIGNDPNPARTLAQSADVFLSSTAFNADWQSLTLDLTPLASAADFDAGDFPAGLLYAADGTIRHLPGSLNPSLILYNKGLFDAAGLAYPTPDWTWEAFVTLASQLTQRYGDFTAQYGWVDSFQANVLVGAVLAESLIDYTTSPPTPQLTSTEVMTALTLYFNLFGENGVALTPRSAATAYGETQVLIQDRRVAMWPASYTTLGNYSSLDVGVVPLPIFADNEEQRLYTQSFGFAASAATQQPALAWQLIEYLSRQQGFGEELIPARTSVRQATGFWDGVDPQIAAVVEAHLDHAFELPYAGTQQALRQAVTSVLLEETALLVALAAQEEAVQQRLLGETEPLAAVVSEDMAAVTGRILFITDGMHLFRHEALARAFEAENPDLRVDVEVPLFSFVRSMDRTSTGQQADCFVYEPLTTQAEVAKVLPLDSLLDLDPNINRDDFYSFVLNAFFHDGLLVGLPDRFSIPLIAYDPSLFDAAGIPYPASGWSLEEFLETAVALTSGEGQQKQYSYVPSPQEFMDFWPFLHAFGVDLLDRSIVPPTANFDTPAIADALRWYVALSETYDIKPVYRTNMFDVAGLAKVSEYIGDRNAIFAGRRGAMWWSDGSKIRGGYEMPEASIEERQYTTFPIAAGAEIALPVDVTGLYISAETEHRQACWQWITFLTEHDAGLGLPARRSVAHAEEFRLRAGPAADVMLQSAEQMSRQPLEQPPEWLNLVWWYSIALTRALEENVTAEEALAATQAEFALYRACVIERELFVPTDMRQRLVECADPVSRYAIPGQE